MKLKPCTREDFKGFEELYDSKVKDELYGVSEALMCPKDNN